MAPDLVGEPAPGAPVHAVTSAGRLETELARYDLCFGNRDSEVMRRVDKARGGSLS